MVHIDRQGFPMIAQIVQSASRIGLWIHVDIGQAVDVGLDRQKGTASIVSLISLERSIVECLVIVDASRGPPQICQVAWSVHVHVYRAKFALAQRLNDEPDSVLLLPNTIESTDDEHP